MVEAGPGEEVLEDEVEGDREYLMVSGPINNWQLSRTTLTLLPDRRIYYE